MEIFILAVVPDTTGHSSHSSLFLSPNAEAGIHTHTSLTKSWHIVLAAHTQGREVNMKRDLRKGEMRNYKKVRLTVMVRHKIQPDKDIIY